MPITTNAAIARVPRLPSQVSAFTGRAMIDRSGERIFIPNENIGERRDHAVRPHESQSHISLRMMSCTGAIMHDSGYDSELRPAIGLIGWSGRSLADAPACRPVQPFESRGRCRRERGPTTLA